MAKFESAHDRLKQKGFDLLKLVSKDNAPRDFALFAIALASKKYSDFRIITLEEAVRNSEHPIPKDKSMHAIYVKETKKRPSNIPRSLKEYEHGNEQMHYFS